jgi:hypothetical protein
VTPPLLAAFYRSSFAPPYPVPECPDREWTHPAHVFFPAPNRPTSCPGLRPPAPDMPCRLPDGCDQRDCRPCWAGFQRMIQQAMEAKP